MGKGDFFKRFKKVTCFPQDSTIFLTWWNFPSKISISTLQQLSSTSNYGIGTRKEVKAYIRKGFVEVNGKVIKKDDTKVDYL